MGINKSRPVYQPLAIDPAGRAHLIVSDLLEIPQDALASDLLVSNIESWVVSTSAPGIATAPHAARRPFRAAAELLTHLAARLPREAVGLRLYAVGTETFLWDVNNIARAAGLGQGEVFLTHAGSQRRRVYCTHCRTMNEDVATSIVACRGCGAYLLVRDHFSRRLAAFMGVAVDAEVPGEIPAAELLYP